VLAMVISPCCNLPVVPRHRFFRVAFVPRMPRLKLRRLSDQFLDQASAIDDVDGADAFEDEAFGGIDAE
jgi:hypothetical protein